MPIVKLFNGEKFAGDIVEDFDSVLVIEDFSYFSRSKRVIPKRDILSIEF